MARKKPTTPLTEDPTAEEFFTGDLARLVPDGPPK